MKAHYILYVLILVVLLFVVMQWYEQRRSIEIFLQLSTIELYAHARLLPVNSTIDPPCSKTQNIYVCAGHCPWFNTDNNEPVSCSFLPRILHPDFVKYNIYCTPDADQCPTYNTWLKDTLPQTRQHIKRIPGHLLSNFTLNYTIAVDSSKLVKTFVNMIHGLQIGQ
jgi:hypothetical protein